MKICVTVEADKAYKEVSDITLPLLKQYCDLHGYGFSLRENPTQTKGIIWERLYHMVDAVKCGKFDHVFHFDADVLITNAGFRLENLMCGGIVVTRAYNDAGEHLINDGVFYAHALGVERLEMVCNSPSGDQSRILCPQDVMNFSPVSKFGYALDIVSVPQKCMNSFLYTEYGMPDTTIGHWTKGDFVLHLPGRTNARRAELFRQFIEEDKIIW